MDAPREASASLPILVRARRGLRAAAAGPDGALVVRMGTRGLRMERLSGGQRAALRLLLGDGAAEDELLDRVAREGPGRIAEWHWHVRMLERLRALEFAVTDADRVLAVLTPLSSAFQMHLEPLELEALHVLSSFAFLRRGDDGFRIESPLSLARLRIGPDALAVVGALARGATPADVVDAVPLAEAQTKAILALLASAGMIAPAGEDAEHPADRAAKGAGWRFADALAHFRSRAGRHEDPYGAKPEPQRAAEPPPRKPPMAGDRVRLDRPDLEELARTDPPLVSVMESRRSIRRYAPRPIDVGRLGDLLYRVASVRPGLAEGDRGIRRPYPSGGACYPLELYVAVRACEGLAGGLYHYDPVAHHLVCLRTTPEALADVLETYRDRGVDELQVLILLTARVNRLSWKYESFVYSTILKEVGILLQSLYLVATAMGLAPCAIAGGHSEALPRALGVDPLDEAAVGEFALGSRL